MATDGIKIPDGWRVVVNGKAKEGDRSYWGETKRFRPISADKSDIGEPAEDFICLIRRKPAPAKKAAKWTAQWPRYESNGWVSYCHSAGIASVRIFATTRAEARRIRDAVLAALNGEGQR